MGDANGLRSPWLVSPGYDIFFFLCLWLPLVTWALPLLGLVNTGASAGLLLLGFHLILRLPHFVATAYATWLRPGQRPYYRERWGEFGVVPVLLFLLFTGVFLTPPAERGRLGHLLTAAAYAWGFQHIAMQSYGLLQLYHARSGRRRPPWEARLERVIFYTLVALILVHHELRRVVWALTGVVLAPSTTELAGRSFTLVLVCLVAVYGVVALRGGFVSGLAFVSALLSLAVLVEWPFYAHLPEGSWFITFNGHHSLVYLGLLFLLRRREGGASMGVSGQVLRGDFLRQYLPLLLVSAAVLLLLWVLYPGMLNAVMAHTELLMGFFVVHYYIESRIWRFSDPHHRTTTLAPLLGP